MSRRKYIFGLLALPAMFAVQATQTSGQACTVNPDCVSGQVCTFPSRTCGDLSLNASSVTNVVGGFSYGLSSNSGSQNFDLQTCLGRSVGCGTPSARPSLWDSLGNNNFHSVLMNNLQPGRMYRVQNFGSANGSSDTQEVSAVTWPGYQTPSDLGLLVSNVADTSATISWQTPFPGDSLVWYGLTSPTVTTEHSSTVSTDFINDIQVAPGGGGWAVGSGGRAQRRLSGGSWTEMTTPLSSIRNVAAESSQRAWISNFDQVYYTTDGGSSWNPTVLGVADSVHDLIQAPETVWAATNGGRILKLEYVSDPSAWILQTSTGINLQNIVTLDNKEIWAVGDGGNLVSSTDGGASWTTRKIGAGSDSMRSVTTLDGKTIWVGATNKLYISSDSGQTWTTHTLSSSGIAFDIHLISPTAGWLLLNNQLVFYDATSQFEQQITTGAPYGGSIDSLEVVNGSHLLFGNQTGNIGGYAQGGTSIQDFGLVTSHSRTFTPGTLVPGSNYFFSASSTGSGVSAGTFGTFQTTAPDTIPPNITITTPPDTAGGSDAYTNVTPFTVIGTATDNIRLDSITLTNNGVPQTVSSTPALPGPTSVSWNSLTNLTPGSNAMTATASDGSPGSGNASASREIIYDTTPPVVAITEPADGSTVNASPTAFSGTATDDWRINTEAVTLNGNPYSSGSIGASGFNWTGRSLTPLSPGVNTVTMTVTDAAGNVGSATSTFTLVEPTFTVTASPSSITANAGDTVNYNVTVTSVDGFAGTVNLSATGTPGGSVATFGTQPIVLTSGASLTSVMTIATNAVTTGTFPITISGTGGGKSDSDSVTLILNAAPDFSLTATPVVQNILGGDSTSYSIQALANSTFSGGVSFSVTGIPTDVNGTFNPTAVSLVPSSSQSTTLNITSLITAQGGSYPLTITGIGGGLTRTVVVTLNITAAPDITLVVTPATRTIEAGQSTLYNGTVTAINGFNEAVTVSVLSAPSDPGLTVTIPQSNVTPSVAGTPIIINVDSTSAVASGLYTLSVTAENGAGTISKTVPVRLQINPDTTPPVITNIVATPNWDSVRITWKTDEPANSAIAIYADAARTSLIGVVGDLSYCTVTCHDLVYTPLVSTTTYHFSVQSCDQAPPANCTTETTEPDGVTSLQFTTLDEPDLILPTVVIDQPIDGTDVIGVVPVSGTAADNKNMSQVQIEITESATSTVRLGTSVPCTGTSCSFASNWNTLSDPNGFYEIKATAQDAAGNLSVPATVIVNVVNDNTTPVLTCTVEVNAQAISGQTSCGGGQCWQAIITWCTDDLSTTQVDYGTSVSCSGGACAYPQGPIYGDPADSGRLTTNHQITLTNLDANQLYHYRITSCNISGLCTH